jgi:importin subunit alpha-6/7
MCDIVWAISNISAGTIKHCDKVMNSAVLERVLDYLSDYNLKLKKEAVYVVSYLCSSTDLEIILKLVSRGVLKSLCNILEYDKNDVVLISVLDTVYNIFYSGEFLKEYEKENRFTKEFDEYGGVTLLENLQTHTNEKIFDLTQKIMERFYITQEVIN